LELRRSDYETYDYREFWQDNKRQYEDYSERTAIRKLFAGFKNKGVIADIGCGFGRLFNEYNDFNRIIMLDYSVSNLKNTMQSVKDFYSKNASARKPLNIYFIAADAENIPLRNEKLDMAISVRLMHHLGSTSGFINEVSRILKKDSVFILEFANKKNLKNILKFILRKTASSPFSPEPLYIGETIRNYHPKEILKEIHESGLQIKRLISVSNFRLSFLKNRIRTGLLNKAENIVQNIFSFPRLGPSIFIKASKPEKDKAIANTDAPDFSDLIMCPSCRDGESGFSFTENEITCNKCSRKFKITDGIYDLRI
jgi:ubiquinone/menaquinone biosynthesis C-methylase UbiE